MSVVETQVIGNSTGSSEANPCEQHKKHSSSTLECLNGGGGGDVCVCVWGGGSTGDVGIPLKRVSNGGDFGNAYLASSSKFSLLAKIIILSPLVQPYANE